MSDDPSPYFHIVEACDPVSGKTRGRVSVFCQSDCVWSQKGRCCHAQVVLASSPDGLRCTAYEKRLPGTRDVRTEATAHLAAAPGITRYRRDGRRQ